MTSLALLRSSVAVLVALAVSLSIATRQASAQAPLRVTTTLHGDGSRTDMQLDADARTAVATRIDGGGKVQHKTVYQLDERNNPVAGSVFDAAGKLLYKSSYVRDGTGRVKEESNFSKDNVLVRRIAYEYSVDGKVTGTRVYDGAGQEIKPKSAARKDEKQRPPRRR